MGGSRRTHAFFLLSFSASALAGDGIVQNLLGDVSILREGKTLKLEKGIELRSGDEIKTTGGASAKIQLPNGGTVEAGPDTTLRWGKTITAVKGTVRASIATEPFAMATPNAVLTGQSTHFQVTVNESANRTSLLTFDGKAAFSPPGGKDAGVIVDAGRFSTLSAGDSVPAIPVRISPSQLRTLAEAPLGSRGKAATAQDARKPAMTPIPPGVDPELAAIPAKDTFAKLDRELGPGAKMGGPLAPDATAQGFVDRNTGRVAPPAGGFVDVKTGIYIPPPPGSAFDPIAQVYLPPPSLGTFDPSSAQFTAKTTVAATPAKLASMTAAPLAPGTDPGAQDPAATTRPIDEIATTGKTPSVAAVAPPKPTPGKVPTFNPNLCPPYCNPLGPPGTRTGNPATTVSMDVH